MSIDIVIGMVCWSSCIIIIVVVDWVGVWQIIINNIVMVIEVVVIKTWLTKNWFWGYSASLYLRFNVPFIGHIDVGIGSLAY